MTKKSGTKTAKGAAQNRKTKMLDCRLMSADITCERAGPLKKRRRIMGREYPAMPIKELHTDMENRSAESLTDLPSMTLE
jgi:hypothetical protein